MDGGEVIRFLMTLLIAAILAFVIWNAFQDENEMHQHRNFFGEVRQFMSAGGRNTAEQGHALCERLNALERESGKQVTNCDEQYPGIRR